MLRTTTQSWAATDDHWEMVEQRWVDRVKSRLKDRQINSPWRQRRNEG